MMADKIGKKGKHKILITMCVCWQNSVNSNQAAKRLAAILVGV